MPSPAPLAQDIPSPSFTCPPKNEVCELILDKTGNEWFAASSYYIVVKPLQIVLIVLVAILIRFAVHRMISRIVRSTSADGPALLRPLHQRMSGALREATGLMSERRRQRAEALGSVLRSIASATVFTVAVMLILDELGVNLAPILASAGIVGIAVGFGAQNLVKDFIAGLFMLFEDQYGVGDVVDVGDANGTVEAVGLRVTTIRDVRGVIWYVRNGEIVRVGNKSQGWALVVVDVPVGFAGVEEAATVLRKAAEALAEDPQWKDDLIGTPEVLGVEHITVDGAVLRTTVKTLSEAQWRVGREMRRCLTEALEQAGIAAQMTAGRVYIRPPGAGEGIGTGPVPGQTGAL